GAAIYTQFVDNNAAPQARTQLTTFTFSYDATFLNGGSAIAWIDSVSNTVKVARYDQSGVKRGSTIEVPAVNMLINSISIAASGDTLLVAYQGTPIGSHHPEVHAAVIDTSGNVTQNVLL